MVHGKQRTQRTQSVMQSEVCTFDNVHMPEAKQSPYRQFKAITSRGKAPGTFTKGVREKTTDTRGFDTDRIIFKDLSMPVLLTPRFPSQRNVCLLRNADPVQLNKCFKTGAYLLSKMGIFVK